jgi:hypothetical protein
MVCNSLDSQKTQGYQRIYLEGCGKIRAVSKGPVQIFEGLYREGSRELVELYSGKAQGFQRLDNKGGKSARRKNTS